jgi:hypothetical protein
MKLLFRRPIHDWRLAAVVVCLIAATEFRARAAIEGGPTLTNEIQAKERLQTQFFQAEQSYQEKLRVGRERYAKKQEQRAKIVAAMNSELEARRQMIVIHSPAEADNAIHEQIVHSIPWMIGVSLLSSFGMLVLYLKKRGPLLSAPRCPLKKTWKELILGWIRPYRPRYKVTAIRPITIWANVEIPKGERPASGNARGTKFRPGWIELQPGESRAPLALVVGVRADCVPHGRRIFIDGADADIVPLGAWTDKELPKSFFESFKMELAE